MFIAESITTQRVESINAKIKRYLNSKSEISGLIDLLEDLEKEDDILVDEKKSRKNKIIKDNLLLSISEFLGALIYSKHAEQYDLHFDYIVKEEVPGNLNLE